MKIAIVGAGVSGLTAAYLLSSHHEVTLFEREQTLGGHAHTVNASDGERDYPVDTGFLVFNEATYPNFIRLLKELGVASKVSTMSFSYRDVTSGLEWKGTSLNTIFAQRRNIFSPRFLRMVFDILLFNRRLRALVKTSISPDLTLTALLGERHWSREFVEWYLVPMGAAIWSANPLAFGEIPAKTFAEFFSRHGLLSLRGRPVWRTVVGGSTSYVERIRKRVAARGIIRVATPVTSIEREDDGVLVTSGHGLETYDHVVIACHSDDALELLQDASVEEKTVLGAIRYQPNEVTLHWDTSLMPQRSRAWAAWNYRRENDDDAVATLTYDITALQSIPSARKFLVSLNSDHVIDPAKVLARFTFEHPVMDHETIGAQGERHTLVGSRTSFCGAYFGYGFHEDGVRSALEVCEKLGVTW